MSLELGCPLSDHLHRRWCCAETSCLSLSGCNPVRQDLPNAILLVCKDLGFCSVFQPSHCSFFPGRNLIPPPLLPEGWGVYFEPPPPQQEFYTPPPLLYTLPSVIHPSPLEGYFQGWGGGIKLGPPSLHPPIQVLKKTITMTMYRSPEMWGGVKYVRIGKISSFPKVG